MASAFDYLSRPIKQYIYEKGWHRLRPIQEAAGRMVFETDHNLILLAPTASGKTEAAFLPAISQVEDWSEGVKILAISPLIALINDQVSRVYELCADFDIPVLAWHGEASRQAKKRLEDHPSGIVFITPESLEAMLSGRPGQVSRLFSRLDWIIVDELHHFLSGNRGIQLRSLLARLSYYREKPVRYIGLSATIAQENYPDCKSFFPTDKPTSILLDRNKNPLEIDLHFYSGRSIQVGLASSSGSDSLYDGIYRDCLRESMLIFPNSRRRVEEIANALKRRAVRDQADVSIFAHHSSVEKGLRLEAEAFAKHPTGLFSICCSSTLELGIDIGAVDAVTQVEAPHSSSSLAQRLGRSGRGERFDPKTGSWRRDPSRLHFHATEDWSFLQGLAAIRMVESGLLDPLGKIRKPYDVFAHQILSMILEHDQLTVPAVYELARLHPVWTSIETEEIDLLLNYLLEEDFLELVEEDCDLLIIGIGAEQIIGRPDFYAMFSASEDYEIIHGREKIGSLPPSPEVMVGACILLSARVWQIISIEDRTRKIRVVEAASGKAPSFGGTGGEVTGSLRQMMLELIRQPPEDLIDNPAYRELFRRLQEQFPASDLIQWTDGADDEAGLTVFAGSAVERTIYLYLRSMIEEDNPAIFWESWQGKIRGNDLETALHRAGRDLLQQGKIDFMQLENYLADRPAVCLRMLEGVKYSYLLPSRLKARYILLNLCDPEAGSLLMDYLLKEGEKR